MIPVNYKRFDGPRKSNDGQFLRNSPRCPFWERNISRIFDLRFADSVTDVQGLSQIARKKTTRLAQIKRIDCPSHRRRRTISAAQISTPRAIPVMNTVNPSAIVWRISFSSFWCTTVSGFSTCSAILMGDLKMPSDSRELVRMPGVMYRKKVLPSLLTGHLLSHIM